MLVNPATTRLPTIPGTRILQDSFGIAGFQMMDPGTPQRVWTLQCFYAPIPRRKVNGVRAKFVDNKNFVSFCNQRDLEVVLGIGKPGTRCHWSGSYYPEPGDQDWFGLCVDDVDLDDDLFERELRLREHYPEILPTHIQMLRRVHDDRTDYEELFMLLQDIDVHTGYGPDPRLETLKNRWVRVERTTLQWELTDF